MSDFLRNLRSSHKKNPSDPKRNLDGHFYPQNNRRKQQDRRTSTSPGNRESIWDSLQDLLPQVVENSSSLTFQLERMVEQNDLFVEAKIRQYNTIATFFENLNKFFNDDFFVKNSDMQAKATASYASGTHYTKDDILTIIRTMREKGSTFSIIADYLKDKGIPTFSGRGEWHAQTIHRLCK